jgi:predicted RNA-binding protein with PIN domain
VRRRRHPIALPGGVLDDSADAANHLVRIPGVRVVVDGYNVAKLRWPTLGPSELRERLLAAVAAVAARTGARFHVVFDGDGAAASTAVQRRVGLRVTFTAKDVEADDAILALVEREPDGVPVVVVSNDRRVADGARERGAAALGVEAFFGTWTSA